MDNVNSEMSRPNCVLYYGLLAFVGRRESDNGTVVVGQSTTFESPSAFYRSLAA